jgi:hypothetical protein
VLLLPLLPLLLQCVHASPFNLLITPPQHNTTARGIAYALRAAYASRADVGIITAWWALSNAGFGFAIASNAAVLSSW